MSELECKHCAEKDAEIYELRRTLAMIEERCKKILVMHDNRFSTNKFTSYDLARDVTKLARRAWQ